MTEENSSRHIAIITERTWSGEGEKSTSGPASAQESSEVNRTTERAGSSSEVGKIVVIVQALCSRNCFSFAAKAEQIERERRKP